MAKKKVASRAAAQPAVKKKWSGTRRQPILSPQDRQVQGEGRVRRGMPRPARRRGKKQRNRHQPSTARRISRPTACALTRITRPRHCGCYHGLAQAHVIRLIGSVQFPAEVSKLTLPRCRIQMVSCSRMGEDLHGRPGRDAE